jgi:acyl-CoA reductase-like NAD-dependent aldehyde dehydrogenase
MESVVFVVLMLQVSFVSFVCLFTHLFALLGKSRELYWRKYHLQRLHDLIKQNEERFYEALANDMKKPRLEAFVGDISPVLEECVYFLDVIRKPGFAGTKSHPSLFSFFGHCVEH